MTKMTNNDDNKYDDDDEILMLMIKIIILVDPATYMTKFQWDSAKYPIKQPLRNLAEIISKVRFLK